MGINARAKLFYGIVISKIKLLKIASGILGDEVSEDEEYERLEWLAKRVGGKSIWLYREGYDENDEHGIAVWEKTTYDFTDTKKFKLPDVAALDEKWKSIQKGLGIKAKAGWYLWTEYS